MYWRVFLSFNVTYSRLNLWLHKYFILHLLAASCSFFFLYTSFNYYSSLLQPHFYFLFLVLYFLSQLDKILLSIYTIHIN